MLEAHVLASGSDGNCTVIQCDDEAVIIDAGLSCRRFMSLSGRYGVDTDLIKAILVTHEHTDHVSGVGPIARKLGVPVMATPATFDACNMGKVDYIPIDISSSFEVGGMRITPIPTSHDAVDPCCYFTQTDQGNVLLATDTGKLSMQIEHALSLADIAIMESNYDPEMLVNGPYPAMLKRRIGSDRGHLSNFDCGDALRRNLKQNAVLFLAHLSKTNNVPDLARDTVAKKTGLNRSKIDCMEFQYDFRTLRARV